MCLHTTMYMYIVILIYRFSRNHRYYDETSQSVHVVGYASEWQFSVLCSNQSRHEVLSKLSFYYWNYGFILLFLWLSSTRISLFHLFSAIFYVFSILVHLHIGLGLHWMHVSLLLPEGGCLHYHITSCRTYRHR